MKRFTALFLTAAMLFALCACGSGGASSGQNSASMKDFAQQNMDQIEQVARENNITSLEDYPFDATRRSTANTDERYPSVSFAQSFSPTEWQPYNLQDAAKTFGKYMIYEFLLDRVGADEYENRLAKDWYHEDGTHTVVEIYDNIYDSDGNHITASDVVFSYRLNVNSGYAQNFEYYSDVEQIDTYKVRFTWTEPFGTLNATYYLLANVAIVSEKAYSEHDFAKDPVGTGPYKLTKFVTDSYCIFEVNENYWQEEALRSKYAKQNVQTIHVDFVTDSSMRMIMLQNGTSICNPYLSVSDIESLLVGGEYEGQFNLTTSYNTQSTTLIPNMSEGSIMSDINMRLACWYAIDSAALVAALGANANSACVVDAAASIGDYQDSWNDIESYQTQYSIEKSKEYQEKAGYNGETIKILAGTFTTKKMTAQVIAEMLRQAGINTEIQVVEYVVQQQTLDDPNNWDIYTDSQLDNDYTINRLRNVYSVSVAGAYGDKNKSYIYDKTFEDMISKCAAPGGYSVEATEDVLHYIIDNAYGYGTSYITSYVAWNKDIATTACPYGNTTTPLLNCCDYYLD